MTILFRVSNVVLPHFFDYDNIRKKVSHESIARRDEDISFYVKPSVFKGETI
jgi:hypothetical protein